MWDNYYQNKMLGNSLISVKEYAERRQITTQRVYALIKAQKALPGIKSVVRVGNHWMLEVGKKTQQ